MFNFYFLGIKIKSAQIENTFWRSNNCSILTDSTKRCKPCDILFPYFRTYRKRSLKPRLKYIGPTLSPMKRIVFNKIVKNKKRLKQNNCR